MANQKITFKFNNEILERDYQEFIDAHYNNNFHYYCFNNAIMTKWFKRLNINDEQLQKNILSSFEQKIREDIEHIQMNTNCNDKEFNDFVYNFLLLTNFHTLEQKDKIRQLNNLKIKPYKQKAILEVFSLKK